MTNIIQLNPSSHIPLGLLLPAAEYGPANPRFRGFVLEQPVEFDPLSCANAHRSRFSALVIDGPRTPMLLLVIQLGDAVLSWLADPAEPAVWSAIGSWNTNGSVSVALSCEKTHLFVIPLTRRIDKTTLLRPVKPVQSSAIFTNQAIEVFSTGAVNEVIAAHFAAGSKSSHCVIHTEGVATALAHQGYQAEYDSKANKFVARKSLLVSL
ncbi:hypothetical protein [Paraburkholderia tagetis]|uniref:Uncharacterized protein n=1 Tax=Paraburkholderia tagetis TaxID=2913261 RepID=A0A9X1ULD2_9BURK|nr:hypothetical protein [Paraburkholderia tagetis]MCG5077516.1 hypothetical protein [Paraburkholderia tagetis]